MKLSCENFSNIGINSAWCDSCTQWHKFSAMMIKEAGNDIRRDEMGSEFTKVSSSSWNSIVVVNFHFQKPTKKRKYHPSPPPPKKKGLSLGYLKFLLFGSKKI